MPLPTFQRVHRIPKHAIAADLRELNREGERVVSCAVDGEVFVVITEPIGWPPQVETRVVYSSATAELGGDA